MIKIATSFCFTLLLQFCMHPLAAQEKRMLTTYSIATQVNPSCTSVVSLTLFEQGGGNDTLNNLLIQEMLGHYMQSKPLQKLDYFYEQRNFGPDSAFDYTLFSSCTYSNNDLYSFTVCPRFACNKADDENTMETEMATLDARTGRMLDLKDFIDPAKADSLAGYLYKIVTMYRIRNLPVCKVTAFNPNQIATTSGTSTPTDTITYERGYSHKFYLSNERFHFFNKVRHRDYDYTEAEIAVPVYKLGYFLKPAMAKRLGL